LILEEGTRQMGKRGASWQRQTAQGQIRSTNESTFTNREGRREKKRPVSSLRLWNPDPLFH
jgi:hypothetical protein